MVRIGDKAPEFILPDKDGKLRGHGNILSDYLVVYFYPKDNTPGCTIEAQMFTQAEHEFKKLHATVVGISGGDSDSKKKFCSKHGLTVLLLSDPDFKTARAYGAFGRKSFAGKEYEGILRNTYLLDKSRRIIRIFEKVDPSAHVDEVLAFLRGQ